MRISLAPYLSIRFLGAGFHTVRCVFLFRFVHKGLGVALRPSFVRNLNLKILNLAPQDGRPTVSSILLSY